MVTATIDIMKIMFFLYPKGLGDAVTQVTKLFGRADLRGENEGS